MYSSLLQWSGKIYFLIAFCNGKGTYLQREKCLGLMKVFTLSKQDLNPAQFPSEDWGCQRNDLACPAVHGSSTQCNLGSCPWEGHSRNGPSAMNTCPNGHCSLWVSHLGSTPGLPEKPLEQTSACQRLSHSQGEGEEQCKPWRCLPWSSRRMTKFIQKNIPTFLSYMKENNKWPQPIVGSLSLKVQL